MASVTQNSVKTILILLLRVLTETQTILNVRRSSNPFPVQRDYKLDVQINRIKAAEAMIEARKQGESGEFKAHEVQLKSSNLTYNNIL